MRGRIALDHSQSIRVFLAGCPRHDAVVGINDTYKGHSQCSWSDSSGFYHEALGVLTTAYYVPHTHPMSLTNTMSLLQPSNTTQSRKKEKLFYSLSFRPPY